MASPAAVESGAPERPEIDRDLRLRMYRTMLNCRSFEQRTHELFLAGLVRGTTHLGIGQEAVAAGVAAAMRDHPDMVAGAGHPAEGAEHIASGRMVIALQR